METFSALLATCAGNSPHKGQWRGALMFSLICVWINGRTNNGEAGDLRRHRPYSDVIVMLSQHHKSWSHCFARSSLDMVLSFSLLNYCSPRGILSITCTVAATQNNRNAKHIPMFSQKQPARQRLGVDKSWLKSENVYTIEVHTWKNARRLLNMINGCEKTRRI